MSKPAVIVQGLSKCYRLGETHEHTLSDQLVRLGARIVGRKTRSQKLKAEDFWALRDVDLSINEGEAVGIIGSNGAGKSTLLKILSRITPPTSGRAMVRGRLSSLLEVGTGFHPELTGRENVFLNGAILGMRKAEVARKFDEIVAFAGVERFIDTPVKRYSSGMYVRLAFAVAAHLEPDVLVIDEVLAVGDAEFQKRCLGKMGDVAREGRTVIFVSHNMAAVQKLCSRAVWLRSGQVRLIGTPNEVVGSYLDESNKLPSDAGSKSAGFIYSNDCDLLGGSTAKVDSIQLLDRAGLPVDGAKTWQDLTVRVRFTSNQRFRAFSVVLQVATPDSQVLILTSTTPDHNVAFPVEPGSYVADCRFDRLPLAAGEYVLGAGLAIPGVEYVWRDDALARLQVAPHDVFRSGLPPAANRYLLATDHAWAVPTRVDAQFPDVSRA